MLFIAFQENCDCEILFLMQIVAINTNDQYQEWENSFQPTNSFLSAPFHSTIQIFVIKWSRHESLFYNANDSVEKRDVTERKRSKLKGEARQLYATVEELYGNRCIRGGFSECYAP